MGVQLLFLCRIFDLDHPLSVQKFLGFPSGRDPAQETNRPLAWDAFLFADFGE